MAVVRVDERADFTFEAGGLDTEVLRIVRFHGTEGISELSRFQMELSSTDPDVDFDALVGEKGCLAWKGMEETRWVHGIVSHFEVTGQGERLTYYSARLVPRMWLLTRRRQSRIFQNLATPDILKKVFEEGGLPSDEFKLSLKRSYKPRKYCVQYRESDFDFASRLMEEEGIFYFFEHTEDGHVLHVADDPSAHLDITGEATLPYRPGDDGLTGGESILKFRYGKAVRTGLVTLRDFDFKKPSLDTTADSSADKWKELEHYDYPGDYHENALGKDLAKIRLQEWQAGREEAEGEGNCRLMVPGYKFTLDQHKRDALNQEYLITEVHHWGSQPQAREEEGAAKASEGPMYHNTFECMPTTRPYRPPRETPRPRVEGPQTAIVTGPSGEEIHTDEYGRVKVRFFWDRSGVTDDKSSCWIRVSQAWAGAGWGSMVIPRIGQEVVVDFIEGDPDRPLITGRVYNGESPPPYDLPGAKTRSTFKSNTTPGGGGSNEIRLEDAGGSEEIYIHAQKDKNVVVENDHTRDVGNNETIHVAKNRDKSVDVDQSETIGSNKKISVGANHDESIGANMTLNVAADQTESVGGNKSLTVAIAHTETIGAACAITVGLAHALTVGAALTETVGGGRTVSIGGGLTENVAKDSGLSTGGGRSVKAGGDYSVSAGGAIAESAGKDVTVQAGGKMGLSAAKAAAINAKTVDMVAQDAIVIKVGSASIEMKKSGDILINGKAINLKGSGDITIKGSNIKSN
jgi:type VI secretion system secreted protein VgrG